MKPVSTHSSRTRTLSLGLLLVGLVLAVLFRDSFVPGQLAFANDAPFGLMDAFSEFRWSNFWRGSWLPLNWVGGDALPIQPDFSHLLFLVGGSVSFNKFIAPLSLLLLGAGAVVFGRRNRFAPGVALLMGLAAALNSNLLSHACWGLGARPILVGFAFLAMAAISGRAGGASDWLQLLPAGLCVGLAVVEGADTGAIVSVYVGAFVVFHEIASAPKTVSGAVRGLGKALLVAVAAAWVASFALSSLVGTQIQGVAGTAQDEATKQKRWEFATGWSYPPAEVSRFAVPGIRGYRMDTPEGGNYWGDVGSDGSPPRFSGGGEYAGVLVLLLAGWAVARAASGRPGQPFDPRERRLIAFWAVASILSLLFAFGHYAPFYRVLYALPYFSTIRIPMKFLHPMHLGLIVLFGYGLEGLRRTYLVAPSPWKGGLPDRLASWWRGAKGFDRGWRTALLAVSLAALAGAAWYAYDAPALTKMLARTPGLDPSGAPMIAAFGVHEAWITAAFLVAYAVLLAVFASGHWAGRERAAFVALGIVLTVDLFRASVPWVQHYDYERRYQSNAVIDVLRTNAWEGRMTSRISPRLRSGFTGPGDGTFPAVQNQWLEHHFQYYRVQTLDIIQMARVPQLDEDFLHAFEPSNPPAIAQILAYGLELDRLAPDQAAQVRSLLATAGTTNFMAIRRLWELTNTRYILGAHGAVGLLNTFFDPDKARFRSRLDFSFGLKSDTPPNSSPGLDDITAVVQPGGTYSLVEFTGALPRAKLFTRWRTETNSEAALAALVDPKFDPHSELILADIVEPKPVAADPAATATITSWLPRDQVVHTKSTQAGVLLLVQRWHPAWKVSVDGQPATLLRANHLFSAVSVPAGEHTVEFHYWPARPAMWVTLSALAAGAVALVLLMRVGGTGPES